MQKHLLLDFKNRIFQLRCLQGVQIVVHKVHKLSIFYILGFWIKFYNLSNKGSTKWERTMTYATISKL